MAILTLEAIEEILDKFDERLNALEALRMKPQPWTEARTLGEQPFGTSHWAGTWKGFPALSLSYCGGATLFYFDGEWKKKVFGNLAELHEAIGVSR
jgi:hypothetical protein